MSKKVHKNKSLLELEANECRWPLGDPRQEGFHFCGAQQVLGRPYCIQHWQLSFVPSKGRHQASAEKPVVAPQLPAPARRAA